MPLNSPGGSTLQYDTSLWDYDIEFTRWQNPAMWHVALGSWHLFHQVAAPCNVTRGSGVMTLNSPGGSILQYGTWLGNHAIAFARWQHPAMWHVALVWHDTEFAQTTAILEFYFRFRFRLHYHSWHSILHQSAKFYPNRTAQGSKKMTSCLFSRWRISAILDFRGPMMDSLKSLCTTSHRSSIETI